MADEYSFDVVSKVDLQAVEDAVNVAAKEMANRYDFKGSSAKIEFDRKEMKFTLTAEEDMRMKAVVDILHTRLAKRGVPLKNLEEGKREEALGGAVRLTVKLIQGIPGDKGKEIAAAVKKSGLKVQPSIQGDQLRMTSKSKDALQQVMALLKGGNYGVDLQFTNYR